MMQMEAVCQGCWPDLLIRVAGLAGESLDDGNVLAGVRRGADDIAAFFGQIQVYFDSLPTAVLTSAASTFIQEKFCNALDAAQAIVKKREPAVRAVAAALKLQCTMTQAEVEAVITAVERPSAAPARTR
jgi:hypothetical protein